jgi:hypothetical protein
MARLAQSMGVGGFRRAVELDLRRAYGPCLKQVGDALEMSAGTSDWRPERCHIAAIGLWRLWAGSDKGRAASRLDHRKGPLRHVAANGIEYGVATSHNLSEIGRLAVREGGAVIVGLSSGSGVERPVVTGSGSPRGTGAIGCSTSAIGSAPVVAGERLA